MRNQQEKKKIRKDPVRFYQMVNQQAIILEGHSSSLNQDSIEQVLVFVDVVVCSRVRRVDRLVLLRFLLDMVGILQQQQKQQTA